MIEKKEQKTIVDILLKNAHRFPDKKLFVLLNSDVENPIELSYKQLVEKVNILGVYFKNNIKSDKALLLYSDNIDFIIAFLACQLTGITAIPMYPPRGHKHIDRLLKIIEDASVDTIFTMDSYHEKITKAIENKRLKKVNIVVTDKLNTPIDQLDLSFNRPKKDISFIQYTSGSTGNPKGVIITHKNLLHNQQLIKNTFCCDESSIICSWLPFYHDMGLIGNILHAIFTGCTAILMSPFQFIQQPKSWLYAISKYKVTHSGAPNFAYELCANEIDKSELNKLDLSSWQVAYNGSETVQYETIKKFSRYFEKAGFNLNSFYPCYGLAEATLLVSGRKDKKNDKCQIVNVDSNLLRSGKLKLSQDLNSGKELVASGMIVDDTFVKIVDVTTSKECNEFEVGEICISGDSVSPGYFGKGDYSFLPENHFSKKYFKTGDLGFIYQKHLYVVSRIKEMIIIRGKNYYPQDIEFSACSSHEAIENNGIAAFSISSGVNEELILFVEIKRNYRDIQAYANIIKKVELKIIDEIGIKPFDIILINNSSIPRTSSGKIQRFKCISYYFEKSITSLLSLADLSNEKDVITTNGFSYLETYMSSDKSRKDLINYLEQVFLSKLPCLEASLNTPNLELTAIGIDSLKTTEIINTINKDLNINIETAKIFQNNTVSGLISTIETTLWLSNNEITGEEIIV